MMDILERPLPTAVAAYLAATCGVADIGALRASDLVRVRADAAAGDPIAADVLARELEHEIDCGDCLDGADGDGWSPAVDLLHHGVTVYDAATCPDWPARVARGAPGAPPFRYTVHFVRLTPDVATGVVELLRLGERPLCRGAHGAVAWTRGAPTPADGLRVSGLALPAVVRAAILTAVDADWRLGSDHDPAESATARTPEPWTGEGGAFAF